jgi:hypothetical protein
LIGQAYRIKFPRQLEGMGMGRRESGIGGSPRAAGRWDPGARDDPDAESIEALSRRAFLRRGAAVSLGFGAAALAANGVWVPSVEAGAVDDPLGIGDPALQARGVQRAQALVLSNAAIAAQWSVDSGRLHFLKVSEPNGAVLPVPDDVFTIILGGGEPIRASEMRVVGTPKVQLISTSANAARLAERLPGHEVTVRLEDYAKRLQVDWRAELRDGARYVRQEITVRSSKDIQVREIVLVDLAAGSATINGTVKGSPIVIDRWYASAEHPLAMNAVNGARARSSIMRELPLRANTALTLSSVVGTTRAGQMRRDFLAYVERERAHPYRPFLHYNSWYDLGYFSKFNEPEALAVIAAFGDELQRQRGVDLDSFLFDDGWDDPKTLWGFHSGFPDGFARVREAAARYGAAPGVWMSPWGGYGKPKQDRLTNGKAKGFETNAGGFALSGPVYYKRFLDTCLTMIRRYGVNQFKFDGTGNADRAFPGSQFGSDFEAAIALMETLRREKPDLYVNLTTGTYPSPFWLRWADSIWRGGEDHEFLGPGPKRQQWITYRDADTYANVVRRGPLIPINSLMLHGLIFARSAKDLASDPQNDFPSEVRSYFGTGTQLQEMYITPKLLSKANWDVLAESAKWSRRNAATLVDTHWIGGDPSLLQPYGWASWGARGGIITLRNPGDRVQAIAVDVQEAFELPPDAPRAWRSRNPFPVATGRMIPGRFIKEQPQRIDLKPFEVLTLEISP